MFYLVPEENFPNKVVAVLFMIFSVFVFVTELRIFGWQRFTSGKYKDKGSLLLLLIVSGVNLLTIWFLGNQRVGQITPLACYVGLPIMMVGFFLREWSIRTLKHLFTPIVSIHKNHELIVEGPYKYVRHPSYTGLLLEFLGAALAAGNILAFLIVFVLIVPAIFYRIRLEERVLVERFNSDYLNYQKTTKRLLPFLI